MNSKLFSATVRIAVAVGALVCLSTVGQAQDGERSYSQWTWNDASLRSVFDQLSKVGGTDIVLDPGVHGTITLSVTDKTWKDVFNIVCRMNQLEATSEKNYIYVMTTADFQAQLDRKLNQESGLADRAELEREIIKLSNAIASEMEKPVHDLLSKRGQITVVERNNSIIVYDTKDNIAKIKALVRRLDVEVEQINISAKIIEIGSGMQNDMGIQWSVFGNGNQVTASAQHLPAVAPVAGAAATPTGVISSALEKATFGIINPQRLDVTLEYLLSNSKNRVVAQPQITTVDNKQARIHTGEQVPVTYQDEAKNTIVKMIDAGTELLVVPHITSEGRIMLELTPVKRSWSYSSNGQPIINDQSAYTNVVVNDGETVVIGGLTSNEEQTSEGGIPILKDIPILGALFKKSSKKNTKDDLIIFVTPHIVKRNISEKLPDDTVHPAAATVGAVVKPVPADTTTPAKVGM